VHRKLFGLSRACCTVRSISNEHLQKYGNPGKGNVSYLSATVCDEFIRILAKAVHDQIESKLKAAKYFGVIIDSTPDISHVDQLTISLRYCLPNGNVRR